MSSKIVSGKEAKQATSIEWKPFHVPGSAPARAETSQQSEQLLARIRELETMVEVRAQEAYKRGAREAEQQATARLEPVIKRFADSAQELAAVRPRARRDAEEDIVMLAVAIARKLLHREIAVDPESLLGLVKAAMQRIDAREIHRIRVNPEDARVLEQALNGPASHRRIEISMDPSLERGAAILETSRGNLDASVDTQLKEIERGFLDLVKAKR
jgi:flagellar assembly protein FliH